MCLCNTPPARTGFGFWGSSTAIAKALSPPAFAEDGEPSIVSSPPPPPPPPWSALLMESRASRLTGEPSWPIRTAGTERRAQQQKMGRREMSKRERAVQLQPARDKARRPIGSSRPFGCVVPLQLWCAQAIGSSSTPLGGIGSAECGELAGSPLKRLPSPSLTGTATSLNDAVRECTEPRAPSPAAAAGPDGSCCVGVSATAYHRRQSTKHTQALAVKPRARRRHVSPRLAIRARVPAAYRRSNVDDVGLRAARVAVGIAAAKIRITHGSIITRSWS